MEVADRSTSYSSQRYCQPKRGFDSKYEPLVAEGSAAGLQRGRAVKMSCQTLVVHQMSAEFQRVTKMRLKTFGAEVESQPLCFAVDGNQAQGKLALVEKAMWLVSRREDSVREARGRQASSWPQLLRERNPSSGKGSELWQDTQPLSKSKRSG